jgi:nitrogen fixation NifU-like protein
MNLYKEQLLEHYRAPRNRGVLKNPDFSTGQYNPSCGDSIALQGVINNGIISNLMFTGKGCVISQAASSLLTQACIGKTITYATQLNTEFICELVGIDLGPTRLKCALLPLHALQNGIQKYNVSID